MEERQPKSIDIVKRGLKRRYRSERRFRRMGLGAIIVSLIFLSILFATILGNGHSVIFQTRVELDIFFDPELFSEGDVGRSDYPKLVKSALSQNIPPGDRSE